VDLTVRELQTNAISVVALLTRLANRMAQRREGIIASSHPWLEIAVEQQLRLWERQALVRPSFPACANDCTLAALR